MIVGAETGESESIRAGGRRYQRPGDRQTDRRTDGRTDRHIQRDRDRERDGERRRCSVACTGASAPAYGHRVAISSINRPLWRTASVKTPTDSARRWTSASNRNVLRLKTLRYNSCWRWRDRKSGATRGRCEGPEGRGSRVWGGPLVAPPHSPVWDLGAMPPENKISKNQSCNWTFLHFASWYGLIRGVGFYFVNIDFTYNYAYLWFVLPQRNNSSSAVSNSSSRTQKSFRPWELFVFRTRECDKTPITNL